MPKRLKIPQYAKAEAKKGLLERRENKAGLTPREAKKLGVYSGVAMANKISSNIYLEEDDLKRMGRFYIRFKGCKTKKCETALKLWGGRRFGKLLASIYYP